MSKVLVIDLERQPLAPCHPAVARKLLTSGKAAVLRRFPFTIILKRQVEAVSVQPLRLKLDPGSRASGLAVVNDETGEVVFGAEIHHRGEVIKQKLISRHAQRRGRKTRFRRPTRPGGRVRFGTRRDGKLRQCAVPRQRRPGQNWLPPSLFSRVQNILTWVGRVRRWCPIAALSQELVKFDTQLMQDAETSGAKYQQGELAGYEVREYVLEKFNRRCVYCGTTGVPLEIEHIVPKSRGGSNRVSNLTISCRSCNQAKGNRTAEEFGFPNVQAQARQPLRDAAAVNTTRWALFERLHALGLPLETGSGGLTKYNRVGRGLDKSHWADAACVGHSTPSTLTTTGVRVLTITATGHGTRQRCRPNACGFPVGHAPRAKSFQGFQTGDLVRAVIPNGKFAGVHTGRVAIRFRPSFRLNGFDVHPKYITRLHAADGYTYSFRKDGASPSNQARKTVPATALVGVPAPKM